MKIAFWIFEAVAHQIDKKIALYNLYAFVQIHWYNI